MSSFKRKLRLVFDQYDENARYIPRALNGGPGWQVYDRVEERHLNNAEVRALDIDTLEHARVKPH